MGAVAEGRGGGAGAATRRVACGAARARATLVAAFALLVSLAACQPGAADDAAIRYEAQNEAGCSTTWHEAYLHAALGVGGLGDDVDQSCHGVPPAEPDAACVEQVPLAGRAQDFEAGAPLPGVEVALYDDATGARAPTAVAITDDQGELEASALSCAPLSYRVSGGGGRVVPTFVTPVRFGHGALLEPVFTAVSTATRERVADLLGGVDEARAMLAGAVLDCAGRGVAALQIVVRDADCRVPLGAALTYLQEGIPVRGLTETDHEGAFLAIDLPDGAWIVEAYSAASDEEGVAIFGRVAAAPVQVRAGEVSLVMLTLGTFDGAPLPSSCLVCTSSR